MYNIPSHSSKEGEGEVLQQRHGTTGLPAQSAQHSQATTFNQHLLLQAPPSMVESRREALYGNHRIIAVPRLHSSCRHMYIRMHPQLALSALASATTSFHQSATAPPSLPSDTRPTRHPKSSYSVQFHNLLGSAGLSGIAQTLLSVFLPSRYFSLALMHVLSLQPHLHDVQPAPQRNGLSCQRISS
jgi:hypothetical protein